MDQPLRVQQHLPRLQSAWNSWIYLKRIQAEIQFASDETNRDIKKTISLGLVLRRLFLLRLVEEHEESFT